MYAATSSSGRDLQAMDEEVRHLTERRAELEELELVAMLEQDPIDAELAALARADRRRSRSRPSNCAGQVAEAQVEIDAALGEADERPGGRGGARCRPRSPTATRPCGPGSRAPARRAWWATAAPGATSSCRRARWRGSGRCRPASVATCEQCGRMLVPT